MATVAYKLKQADIQYRKLQKIFEFASFATAQMKLNTNYTFYSIVIYLLQKH